MESITLYFREGSSDKVYRATIEPKAGGFVVHYAYGRRGSTLSTGTKTQSPVPYADAKIIYDKLVKEKQAKGYTAGEDGTPYAHTAKAEQDSGIRCQLLNPINEAEVEHYLGNHDYLTQPKHDGRRLLIQKCGDEITGINRRGLIVALPEVLIAEARACRMDFILDGEAVGDIYFAFDVLSADGHDMRHAMTVERLLRLMNLLASFQHRHISWTDTAYLGVDKRRMFAEIKTNGGEGIVFKHVDALYTPDRPESGGPQLKYKFTDSASFIVAKVNCKRSVSLELLKDGQRVPAGNVTIPQNHDVPSRGQIVECRYLYAFRESGCIYQPVYRGVREDLDESDCTTNQLKYKPE